MPAELQLRVHPEELAGLRAVLEGAYDAPGLEFPSPPRILDLGACIGAATVFFARRWPGARIVAYEPHPEHVAMLEQNVAGIPNVEIRAWAVGPPGAGHRVEPLWDGKDNSGQRSLRRGPEQVETWTSVNVMPAEELPAADILKLDIEGLEPEVLMGYSHLDGVSAVMLEWHDTGDYQWLIDTLLQKGFDLAHDASGGEMVADRELVFVRRGLIVLPDIPKADWRPEIEGWAEDILPYYRKVAKTLPRNAVVVEVGVAHGRSAVYLAEQLDLNCRHDVELWCIDGWGGDWFRRSIVPTLARPELAVHVDRMRIIRCDAVRAARLFDDRSVDLVFIDSDHTLEGMREQLPAWNPKVKRRGAIAGHDYAPADWPGVVQAVDEYFPKKLLRRPTRSVWEVRA